MFIFGDKHKKIRDLLSVYLDNELKAREKDLVDRHLASCDACRQELETLRATVDLLKRIPSANPGRSFLVQVEKKSRPRPAPPIWQPVPVPVIITVLLTIALFLGDILNALPYSSKGLVTFAPSAPAPMSVMQARPESADISSSVPRLPETAKPADAPREAPAAKVVPERQASDSTATPPSVMPQGPPGPAGASSKDSPPAQPPAQLKAGTSIAAPGATPEQGPPAQIAQAPQPAPLPQAAPAPTPVPLATPLPQPAMTPTPAPVLLATPFPQPTAALEPISAPVTKSPVPELQTEEFIAKAGSMAVQGEIASSPVPSTTAPGNFFIVPWRLIEIILALLSVLIIAVTILQRRKRTPSP